MHNKLFNEFSPVSTEQWENKILEDLKGADYNKKLIWKTIEGFNVKPYYRAEDIKELSAISSQLLKLRHKSLKLNADNNWHIRQDIDEDNVEIANKIAVQAIKNGANAIGFNADKVVTKKDLEVLLKDIDLSKTGIHFLSSKSFPELFNLIAESYELTADSLISFNFDPHSDLLLKGNEEVLSFKNFKLENLNLKLITVNGHYYHNSGATAVQELAFSLASANEYLTSLVHLFAAANEQMTNEQMSRFANCIMFSFAAGSSYFIEIAKLRAARLLWARILQQYELDLDTDKISTSIPMFIHSYTSLYNKSNYDPYNNMLRSTTEAMSAALGGADSITVNPFDKLVYSSQLIIDSKANSDQLTTNNEQLSSRIARNAQLILKEESNLDKVIDPSAGSYYIETLTDSIAKAAWDLFKEVEAKGGFLEAVKQNFIQDKIEETAAKRSELVSGRKKTILGVNQYPNQNEQFTGSSVHLFTGTNEQIFKKLKIYRAAEVIEQIRLDTEKYINKGNAKPKVFLFTIGNPAMRRARASFSANFFGCCGYEILDNNGFCSVEEGVGSVINANPQIVVICSSDEEYEAFAPEITRKLKETNKDIIIILAGNPKNIIDKLKEAGVDDFISITSNLQTTLIHYQRKLGIIK